MNDNDELFKLFLAEARDHLEHAEESLLALGKSPDDVEAVQACFRALHSIKGCAGFFDLIRLQDLSHACEHLLDRIRTQELSVTDQRIDALLQMVSHLGQVVEGIECGRADQPGIEADAAHLERLVEVGTNVAPAVATSPMPAAPVDTVITVPPDRALLDDFLAEARELMGRVEELLLSSPANPEQIRAVMRCFHTLKGISAYVGFPLIEKRAHAIEDSLSDKSGTITALSDEQRRALLAAADELRAMASRACLGPAHGEPGRVPPGDSQMRIGDLLVSQGMTREEVEAAAASLKPGERLGDKLVAEGRIPRETVETAAVQQALIKNASDGFSRVATAKLEDLVNLVGELLISQAMVAQDPDLQPGSRLQLAVNRQSRTLRSLQVLALNLRMVPLKSTFKKMSRAVHDIAHKLDKAVDLKLAGEDTEIDRTIAESLADPLLHMIRNAVDHGLETASERALAGKTPRGTIELSATQSGDHVIIVMSDDGRGMDPVRLRRRAVERGLIAAEGSLSQQEIYHLIFIPGFSTADSVTDISGRGVGMDVVRRNVQSLKGSIDIASVLGQGTTFTLRLPLTTAILDVMLLRVGSERFLVPIASVIEASRLESGEIKTILGTGRMVESRGQMLPVVRLATLFDLTDAPPGETGILVVVEHFQGRFALQVDDIVGQQQVVIKPLAEHLPHHPGLAGSAILADGRVGLILDPNRLLEAAGNIA
ncbi:MAG: chemotaxis protein CheA [Planctomycetes bacterium]|nr:chemotaxis protein CheA [Planctomycetota bacterium]